MGNIYSNFSSVLVEALGGVVGCVHWNRNSVFDPCCSIHLVEFLAMDLNMVWREVDAAGMLRNTFVTYRLVVSPW